MIIVDSLKNDMRAKMNKYLRKYDNIFYIWFKLLFFCVTRIFMVSISCGDNKVDRIPSNVLRIAVCLDGGLGDMLVYSVWVKEFSKIVEGKCLIDVFASRNVSLSFASFKEHSFVNRVYRRYLFDNNVRKYDLAFSFRRFPIVTYCNTQKVKRFSPNLIKFIDSYKKFRNDYDKFFVYHAAADTQVDLYSICRNEKRIQQPDINNLLGITEQTKYYLHINDDAFDILKHYNLAGQKYITVTRSVELTQKHKSNVRLWPLEYYETLIDFIKQRYPDLKIVQLGVDRCESLKGIDIDLLGKTNLEQVKAILKYSLLHIDGECGMVHVKHFLGGKSAVFFGQTAVEYLGYDNNINLKSDGCPHWCEWVVDDWQTHCIREEAIPPCMAELKPEFAFGKISEYLDCVVDKLVKSTEVNELNNFSEYFNDKNIEDKKIMFFGREYLPEAKALAAKNKVTIYDSQLDNREMKEAYNAGITMEYGDIYNLPEEENSFDIAFVHSNSLKNKEFSLKEFCRVVSNHVFVETAKTPVSIH